jgi:hypothetical protein
LIDPYQQKDIYFKHVFTAELRMYRLIIALLLLAVTTMSFLQTISTEEACMHDSTEQVCDLADCEVSHSLTDNCCSDSMMRHCYSPSITVVYSEQSTVPPVDKLLFNATSFLDTNIKEKHSLSLFRPPIHS